MGFFDKGGLKGLLGSFVQKRPPMEGERGPFDFKEAALSLFADPQVMAERRLRRRHREEFRLPSSDMGKGIY